MTPADEAAYRSILDRMSAEDRYYRFFKAGPVVDDSDVRRFVDARPDMLGWIAERRDDGHADPRALGAAHAALVGDGTAELAIVVADDARERGVGSALFAAIITYLQNHDFRRIIAHSLQENVAFARLALRIGMRIERAEGADVRWVLDRLPAALVTA